MIPRGSQNQPISHSARKYKELIPVSDLNTQALLMLGMQLNFKSNFDRESYSSTMVVSKPSGNSVEDSALEISIAEKIDDLLLQVNIKDKIKWLAKSCTLKGEEQMPK